MSNFILTDRKTDYLLPPSVDDWLTQDHLARFVVEVVDGLDLSNLTRQYAGRGSKAHHPATLLAILVYGYSTGVFSSRKLEMATYDSVAFRYIAAGSHPDHDTLATFRRRFIDELAGLFVQVLEMATEMKLLKLGTVCLDGTKIHANASRHSALSHGHIVKLEVQLKQEVQELLALAEQADTANIPDGMSLPKELKLREDRLGAMATAKAKIAARAAERYAREKAEFDDKIGKREAKEKETGKKPHGKPPAKLGDAQTLIADTGYCSETNVKACEEAKIEPLLAVARQDHHPHWRARFTEPVPLPEDATAMQAMTHRLSTIAGKAAYAIRKQTVEPVFGIIKSVMGFRQFSLRGLRKVTGEWNLVCLAWNVKRMAVLRPKMG